MARKRDQATDYAKAVTSGKIMAGRPVRMGRARHLEDIKSGGKRGLKWRIDLAQRAIEFFAEMLVLDNGQPFKLEPFQCFIVGSLFGWYGGDGFRRFRTAYCEMGKGSGKSPMAAGIGHIGFIADDEPAPEIYVAATTRQQARIVFTDAVRMVEGSPELKDLVSTQVGSLSIPSQNAVYRPVSAEHRGLDGLRVHMGLIDELHEHPSALVTDKIRAGTKGRRNALIFEITNSGWDRHSVCWNHHEYSMKVLDGVIENDSWFAYVRALDEGDDLAATQKVWPKTNPGLGVTLTVKYLREQVAEAVGMPSKENLTRRLNFCEWTEQDTRAIPMAEWDKPAMAAPIDVDELRGRECYGGLDLAKVSDLSAFVLLFPPLAGELWKLLCWFWVPEADVAHRSVKDRVPYDVWVRQEHMIATPGNTTDYGFIEAKIIDLSGIYNIKEIAFDRTFAGEIVQALASEGLQMIQFGQGFLSMGAPTAELLRMIKAGELQHGGNPVLRWCASNLTVATDPAGNLKPDKERSVEKIDGISAACNAIGRAISRGPAKKASIYETRGAILFP